MIYTHIYISNYDVHVHMILPKHLLVQIWDGNKKLIWLKSIYHYLFSAWVHITSNTLCGGQNGMVPTYWEYFIHALYKIWGMGINERRKRHHVILYIMKYNSKHNSIDIYVINDQRMNVLRYNNQSDIWNLDKRSYYIETHHSRKYSRIKFNDQALIVRV